MILIMWVSPLHSPQLIFWFSAKEGYIEFKACNMVVCPKGFDKYGTFNRKHLDEIFKLGYDATVEALKTKTPF